MNLFSLIPLVFFVACINERAPQRDVDADTADTTEPADTGDDITNTVDNDAAAYTYSNGDLDIDRDFNPYVGERIGFFADGAGVVDGWITAVATVPQSDEGDLTVNLGLFGTGQSVRWALATLDDNNAPVNWLWESGVIAEELVDADNLGLTLWVNECGVQKLNFCTRLTSTGIMPGECALTYVPPEGCTDADGDGDTDPDTGTTDTGTTDTGSDSGGSSGDLVREVCVKESTSAYKLGYMDTGTSDRTHWVTEVSSTATVDSPILTGSSGSTGCVSVTLTGAGTTLKFNGYGSDSALWGHYLVGSGSGSSFAYTSGTTASEVEITVDDNVNGSSDSDAETATFSGYDLVWTD